jgi:transposase
LQVQVKELKKDHPWLKEVNSQSLQVALLHLDRAYSNFSRGGLSSLSSKDVVTDGHSTSRKMCALKKAG